MSIAAFMLEDVEGVVIIDGVTNCPLPVSTGAFGDVEEADTFLTFCDATGTDVRGMTAEQLAAEVKQYDLFAAWCEAKRVDPALVTEGELRELVAEWNQPRDSAA